MKRFKNALYEDNDIISQILGIACIVILSITFGIFLSSFIADNFQLIINNL